ncbi:TetR family transcriptional regulator [Mycobacterium ahvazicum]|uniref:TetR family transcriptional regulator n=2 Tax=Mycobacterium ahvazicum TaxID=1964395 RepID=A0A2K4YGT0_9MYCO|nr:TetR family transcriptional regulator [Mycobacterium ahvazicum]
MNESARFPEFAVSAYSLEPAAAHFIAVVEHLPTRLEERHLQHAVDLFLLGILRRD